MKTAAIAIAVWVALVAVGCGGDSDASLESTGSRNVASLEFPSEYKGEPNITIPGGPLPEELEIRDLEEGTGAEAKKGDLAEIHYVAAGYKKKKKYETTWDNRELFTVTVDSDRSVEVLDTGVEGMRVGGWRELIAPPDLVYGYEAAIYVVKLVKIG